jgi:hypothetical protein
MRMNSCLDHHCKSFGVQSDMKSMNWNGNFGNLYDLIDIQGVKVATNQRNLIFPKDYQEIADEKFASILMHIVDWVVC